jgi:hypothetical protein
MYTPPLTPPIIQTVPQRTINLWDSQLPGNVRAGHGVGVGVGVSGISEDLTATFGAMSPVTSLLVHLAFVGLAVSLFHYAFLSPDSGYGERRVRVKRARKQLQDTEQSKVTFF